MKQTNLRIIPNLTSMMINRFSVSFLKKPFNKASFSSFELGPPDELNSIRRPSQILQFFNPAQIRPEKIEENGDFIVSNDPRDYIIFYDSNLNGEDRKAKVKKRRRKNKKDRNLE